MVGALRSRTATGRLSWQSSHLANRPVDASAVLRDATKIFPACVQCHSELGRALTRDGKAAGCSRRKRDRRAAEPADPALHYELGLLYQRSGDKAAAKSELARSMELYGSQASGPSGPGPNLASPNANA